jgi:type III secretion protein C
MDITKGIKNMIQLSKQRHFICIILLSVMMLPLSVFATQLPWSNEKYSHFSDQEPLESLLGTLAASQNTQISVSKRVDDVVSVHFKNKTAKVIFKALVKAHGLIWYYDGGVLYISKKDEMQTGSVNLKYHTTKEFAQSLRQLGVLDDHFYWVESQHDNTVYFKGPERFVSTVLKMSKVLDKKPAKPRIYKWVDKNGVPNFSSKMPSHFNKSKNLDVVEVDNGVSVVGDPALAKRWLGNFSE